MGFYEFRTYTKNNFNKIKQLYKLSPQFKKEIEVAANVIPMRVSNYVVDELIDWNNIPDDPIFQLTFPQPGMIEPDKFQNLMDSHMKSDNHNFKEKVKAIQLGMNPHPAGQMDLNIPVMDGKIISGMQHKYDETILFFPSQGQFCHSYCTYCFRWAQFAGFQNLKFSSKEKETLFEYVNSNESITDILFTGGDPMVMKASVLKSYLDPFLKEKPGNLSNIRFGTKSLAYWPYRFLNSNDSDELLSLFEKIVKAGYHLSIMAHFSHYIELETPAVEKAIKRIKNSGASVRCQAPLIKKINDDPLVWARMWKDQVRLGAVPYYMFVERDTGSKKYFEVPLFRVFEIFSEAYKHVSGLCRTVRGPSMSASPGKVMIEGITEINGEKVFVLKFVQARNTDWTNKIFFANYNPRAYWLDDLSPAFGEEKFFYEKEFDEISRNRLNIVNQCLNS